MNLKELFQALNKGSKGQCNIRSRNTDSDAKGKRPDGKPSKASHTKDKQTPAPLANSVEKLMNLKEIYAQLLLTKNVTNVRKRSLCYCLPVRQEISTYLVR